MDNSKKLVTILFGLWLGTNLLVHPAVGVANSNQAIVMPKQQQNKLLKKADPGIEAVSQFFLDSSNTLEAQDHFRHAALYLAVLQNQNNLVSLLTVPNNHNIQIRFFNKKVPLYQGAYQGRLAIEKLLLDYQASLAANNGQASTPLHIAVCQGNKQLVEALLKQGDWLESKDQEGKTPLIVAASLRHSKRIIKLLLKKGANVAAKDQLGQTALHQAVYQGYKHIARLLIKNGANIEAQDKQGNTPLHIAVYQGYTSPVKLLLRAGASKATPNQAGDTPLSIAYKKVQKPKKHTQVSNYQAIIDLFAYL
mgnify:CR=1 FL=1